MIWYLGIAGTLRQRLRGMPACTNIMKYKHIVVTRRGPPEAKWLRVLQTAQAETVEETSASVVRRESKGREVLGGSDNMSLAFDSAHSARKIFF
jgi:hypothetical protein